MIDTTGNGEMIDPCVAWLRDCMQECPSTQSLVASATGFYERRLWHQLTNVVEELLQQPLPAELLGSMYVQFLDAFRENVNPLKIAQITVVVAKRCYHAAMEDGTDATMTEDGEGNAAENFLEKVIADLKEDLKRNPTSLSATNEALLYIRAHIAQCKLMGGDFTGCKTIIDECSESIETTGDVLDTSVHASVHFVRSQLAKSRQDYHGFYRSALLYLAYVDDESLSPDARHALAVDLGFAALLGKDIYNFGELLQHKVVTSLDGTEFEWLHGMIKAFHVGDLALYDSLLTKNAKAFGAQPELVKSKTELREKILILNLMQLIFSLPSDDRTIKLSEIGKRTGMNVDGVERLLMRALSAHLIEGSLDSVAGEVTVTWVQPRVLTRPEVMQLSEKIDVWIGKVKSVLDEVDVVA